LTRPPVAGFRPTDDTGTVTRYDYRCLCQLAYAVFGASVLSLMNFSYDALNRVASVKALPGNMASFVYDEEGAITTKVWPNGAVSYFSYHKVGRVTSIRPGITQTPWRATVPRGRRC